MPRIVTFFLIGLLMSPIAVQATTFKIATIAPDGTTWMKEMRAGAQTIEKQTGGRVNFQFFPGGVRGFDRCVLRMIRIGQLQGGAVTAGGLMDISRNSQIYSLPLLSHSLDEVDYV
ncbi:MAG: TRAP transporter substrate-binding protein DctP, partial [Gammaproteobacteria bacterium]